jgi:large conductance mechanosensitive channel
MFIQYVVDFLIMAVCVFLLVKLFAVLRKKADEMKEKAKKEEEKNIQPPAPPAPPAPSAQELLLTEIRDILKATK